MGFFCFAPGDFKRRLPRTPSTGTMSSADDLDEREPPSPSDNGGECQLGVEKITQAACEVNHFARASVSSPFLLLSHPLCENMQTRMCRV